MVSLVNPDRWAPLIGRLFISFGSIESITHECIRNWSSDAINKYGKRPSLSRRIDLAIDLLALQPFSQTAKATFLEDLRKAKKLLVHRNIIAHSPLALVLFREKPEIPLREAIASNSGESQYVEFEELQEAVEQAEEIATKCYQHMAGLRFEGLNLQPPVGWKGLNGGT